MKNAPFSRMLVVGIALGALFCLNRSGVPAQDVEKLPAGLKIVRVEAFPQALDLKNPFDYRQLLLTGLLASGERMDLRCGVESFTSRRVGEELDRLQPASRLQPQQRRHATVQQRGGLRTVVEERRGTEVARLADTGEAGVQP